MSRSNCSLTFSLSLLGLAAAPLSAQNVFEIFPTRVNISTTDYTRLAVPASGGEILVAVTPADFCNVGFNGGCTCNVTGIDVTLVDLNDATPHRFRGVLRLALGGLPLCTSPWTTMTGGRGGPSVETFRVGMPCPIPCNALFYFGIEVEDASCDDGIYVAASRYQFPGCNGETGRAGTPSLLFSGPPLVAWPPTVLDKQFSLRMGVTVDAPVLNMGNRPGLAALTCKPWWDGYGMGGLYPKTAAPSDVLLARVQDAASPNNMAILIGVLPGTPICVPFGWFCISPPVVTLCTIPLDDTGIGTCAVLPLNPTFGGFTLAFQAFSIGANLLTNAQTVHL